MARTLEARNELDKAIKQYEKVAKTWPGTDEARQAEHLAQELQRPESVAFYKELYAFKAPEVTLPPMGQRGLNLLPNHPPINGPTVPASLLPPPPPSPPPIPLAPTASETGQPPAPGLPLDIFAPVVPAPQAGLPQTEAPKIEASKTELPNDSFAPETKGRTPKP